jgi:hypothetical protein
MVGEFWEMYEVVDEADEPAVRRFLLKLIERFSASTAPEDRPSP